MSFIFSPAISHRNQTFDVMVCGVVNSPKATFVEDGTDCAEHQTTLKCVKSYGKFRGATTTYAWSSGRLEIDTTTESKAFLQISEVTNPRQTTTDANSCREILLIYTIGIFHDLSTCDPGAFTMQGMDLHDFRSHVKSQDTEKWCMLSLGCKKSINVATTSFLPSYPVTANMKILQAQTGEFCV